MSNAITFAAVVQALSAATMVWLTWRLARTTDAYARESRRMADVVVREFELKLGPLLEFAYGNRWSGDGWRTATVPMTVRNLGHYPVEIVRATLEFRVASSAGEFITDPIPAAAVKLESGHPHGFDLLIPLHRVPAGEQSGPTPRKNLVFRICYAARNATGAEVTGSSPDFLM